MKTFLIHKGSDAVFHEESEFVISFKIQVDNDGLSPFFDKLQLLFIE